VLIAAHNEAKVIARTIERILESDYPHLEIVVVDDGSTDATAAVVAADFGAEPRVVLLQQQNAGKGAALNNAIARATGEILIGLDADTIFARDAVSKLVRHFADTSVGAVAGNVKVGNRINVLTQWQSIEYITSQNLDRRAYSLLNAVTVVPGAIGAWRRQAVEEVFGYLTDTMAEDMDLTWRIRLAGWKIQSDVDALAYTEAPDTWRGLAKQRFRWAYGTLQCLWKHRRALGRYGWFGRSVLPAMWLFQILFQLIAPLVDLALLWSLALVAWHWSAQAASLSEWAPLPEDVALLLRIAFLYALFFVVDFSGALLAFRFDKEHPKALVWLFWQRFLYRQLMYGVVLKSARTALQGLRTGWGKLERKGTVQS
jgi:cellulose synthase/poly-beta-1,6-N-acetylglucosamine synthase-like glycosyltransferase